MKKQKKQLIIVLILVVLCVGAYIGVRIFNSSQEEKEKEKAEAAVTHVLQLEAEKVTGIEYTYRGETVTLVRNGDSWYCEQDDSKDLDTASIETMLSALLDVTSERLIADVKNPAEYGFDEPELELTVTAGDEVHTLTFGLFNDILAGYYIAADSDTANVYLVGTTVHNAFAKSLDDIAVKETEDSNE